jgi:methyltransferase, FkbM family
LRIEAPTHLWMARHFRRPGLSAIEPDTMAVLLALTESTASGAVFDVGANAGPFALVGPALFDRDFVAFEPAPDVGGALREMVALNGLRCTVETMAVGDEVGFTTLYLSGKSDLSNSLRPGFRAAVGTVEVPVTTLDAYASRSGLWPSVLKLDTETTEATVLRGATEVLGRRPWIVCEVLPDVTEQDLQAALEPFGYRFYRIEDQVPFTASNGIVADDKHRNWLFAPEEPTPAMWAGIARWRAAIDAVPRT